MSKNSNTLTSNASAILESCSSLGFLLSVSYFFNVDKFIPLFFFFFSNVENKCETCVIQAKVVNYIKVGEI